jgi:hypothetical protein
MRLAGCAEIGTEISVEFEGDSVSDSGKIDKKRKKELHMGIAGGKRMFAAEGNPPLEKAGLFRTGRGV